MADWFIIAPTAGSGSVLKDETDILDCPGYHAIRLLVTAPDQATSAVFAAPGPLTPVCWGFEVHPVVPGATGRSGDVTNAGAREVL
jgi:hypothetical protein